MEKNKGFIVASIRERLGLVLFIRETAEFDILTVTNVESYDKYDAILQQEVGNIFFAEIKVRINSMDKYDDWIIEEEKYDYLIQKANENNATPIYINIHPDGVQIWDLKNIKEPEWIQTQLPSTTQGDGELIYKTNGGLYSKDAKQFKLYMNITELTLEANRLYINKTYND